MQRELGVNTWVWTSPLTDATLVECADRAAAIGYTVLELPVENPGDWDPAVAAEELAARGMKARVVGAMGEGRDLVEDATRSATQDYLRHCVDVAVTLGSPTVAGPFTARTGRVWRMSAADRAGVVAVLRQAWEPVVGYAYDRGVTLAIEPLNRYETSIVNTVAQAREALGPLLGRGVGLALDTYHLGIEERSMTDAIRLAGPDCHVVQVCGNDRGPAGGDQTDWAAVLGALDEIGYAGPLTLESFTGDNDTIATAASIWRPLAATQDALARSTFEYLAALQRDRDQGVPV